MLTSRSPNAGRAGVRRTEIWECEWSWVAEERGSGVGRWQAYVGLNWLEELMGKTAAQESRVYVCMCVYITCGNSSDSYFRERAVNMRWAYRPTHTHTHTHKQHKHTKIEAVSRLREKEKPFLTPNSSLMAARSGPQVSVRTTRGL